MGNIASALYLNELNFSNWGSLVFVATALAVGLLGPSYPLAAPIGGTFVGVAGVMCGSSSSSPSDTVITTEWPNQIAAGAMGAAAATAMELFSFDVFMDANQAYFSSFIPRVLVGILSGLAGYASYERVMDTDEDDLTMAYRRWMYWLGLFCLVAIDYYLYDKLARF